MKEIANDLRKELTVSDCNTIAKLLSDRGEGNADGPYVKKVIQSDGFESHDTVEGAIKRIAKYYLTLKRLNENVLKNMVTGNTRLGTEHFNQSIKREWVQMTDHINELDVTSWYQAQGAPA